MLRIGLFLLLGVLATSAAASEPTTVNIAATASVTKPTAADQDFTVLQFDVNQVAGKSIDYGVFEVQFVEPADGADAYVVTVYPLTRSWDVSTDWSGVWSSPAEYYDTEAAVTAVVSRRNGYKARIDLHEFLRLWSSNELANNGLILLPAQPGNNRAQRDVNAPGAGVSAVAVYVGAQ